MFGEFDGLRPGEARKLGTDIRQRGRGHRQRCRAESDQHDGEERVRRGLATDPDRSAESCPRLSHLSDEAKDGGMPGILE
jgi:hypothetical protein